MKPRRGYLDWLRGIAVLIMIEAHVFDSWTRFPDNRTREFAYAMILGGFGAPLFLFLAGVVVPLSAGAKWRRSNDARAASRAVARRGLQIFALAFLFRAQSWVLGWGHPRDLLKVDILNVMGPSMIAAALLWPFAVTTSRRVLVYAAAATITVLLTPLLRAASALATLPDPVEAYLRPTALLSNFVFFPWAAFVFAGALAGVLLDAARTADEERRLNLGFIAAGLAIAWLAHAASFRASIMPAWYPLSSYWTTSATFFVLRAGLLIAAIGAAWLWESRGDRARRWSPVRQLGRTSLFIYWIHVEMVYGLVASPLHKSLSWGRTWILYLAFVAFMLLCSLAKDRVVDWWRGRRALEPVPAVSATRSS